MQQFIFGFVVGVSVAGAVLFFLRKKTGKTPRSKNEKLKELEKLSKLTGELAHEIKNPLSTIKINLKLAAEELESSNRVAPSAQDDGRLPRVLRKISVIQKEADRLEQILNGFLLYIDRGRLQLSNVNANSLISEMIDFYSAQAHSHSITIREGLSGGPLICKVDADMLKQVILNLFINAQQAMKNGGELIIRTDKQNADAVIQISDTGSGIAPDKLPDIFNAFYTSRPGGSGLGLPTAKKIVEAHKGTIAVISEAGKGTSFTIKLPLAAERPE